MPLRHARLPPNARLLIFLHLRHTLPVHFPILINQPAAQDSTENGHHQAHPGRDPHAFPVQWSFVFGEDVRTCVQAFRQFRIVFPKHIHQNGSEDTNQAKDHTARP